MTPMPSGWCTPCCSGARDDKRRPQDAADLKALFVEAEQGDLALAEKALALITERGFARGRDLKAAWRTLLDDRT